MLLYAKPTGTVDRPHRARWYVTQSAALLLFFPLAVIGMRGGAATAVRPITLSNANQYVNQPVEAAIVLNTPVSIIRTLGKSTFEVTQYYDKQQLAPSIRLAPAREPPSAHRGRRRNNG